MALDMTPCPVDGVILPAVPSAGHEAGCKDKKSIYSFKGSANYGGAFSVGFLNVQSYTIMLYYPR